MDPQGPPPYDWAVTSPAPPPPSDPAKRPEDSVTAAPVELPAWQPWVGLIGMLACTVATVWVAGRIFRVGILMQGQPPKIKDLVRWAVKG